MVKDRDRHKIATDDLNPDLPKRRALREFARSRHTSEEQLTQLRRHLGSQYHRYEPREALERFSYDERSMTRLEEVYELVAKLRSAE